MKLKILLNSKSGVILLVTIWILIILAVLSVGIGHRNSIGLKLNRFSIDKLKSYYMAKAGLQVVIKELEKDKKDYDNLYECGISLDDEETLEDVLKDVSIGDGFYSVGYEKEGTFVYGLIDEERKINLNTVKMSNYEVLKNLFELLDIDSEKAEIIACSIADWHDSDSNVTNFPYGAEDDYYMELDGPYHCKNSPFEVLEELFLVRGMSKEIFLKIKDYVSVFPAGFADLKVNVNTASKFVLQALGNLSSASSSDVDGLVDKIIDYRAGSDNIETTEDDESINLADTSALGLTAPEETLFRELRVNFTTKSDYFRAKIQGIYKDRKVISQIEIILSRQNLASIYWHEE
ncbi:MAG: hypothetical protein ABH954_04300 [Candidatus Omnitrophota bacterium]